MADDIKPHPGPDPAERFARGIPKGDASLPEAPTSRPRGTRRTNALEDVADRMLVLLDVLEHTNSQVAQLLSRQGGGLVNGVLFAGILAFDASGVITREHRVQCGSLLVVNPLTTAVTVHAAPQGGSAPPQGIGVHTVPASSFLPVAIGSHAWTIYGTAGQLVDVTAFAGLQAFGAIG
jgi:hypothetical protein